LLINRDRISVNSLWYNLSVIASAIFDIGDKSLTLGIIHAYYEPDDKWLDLDFNFSDVIYVKSLADSRMLLDQCSIAVFKEADSLPYLDPQYRDHQGSRWISDIAFGEYLDSHDIGRTPEATYESYVLISNDLSMEWLARGLSTTVHSVYAGP
jgi:hypothetical protein